MNDEKQGANSALASEEFSLEYLSYTGAMLSEDLHERQSLLRLTRADHLATKENHGSPDPGDGQFIGRFQMPLRDEDFSRLQALIDHVRPFDLPPATAGVPGAAVLNIIFKQGQTKKVKSFTNREADQINVMRPLLQEFSKLSAVLERNPVEAIQMSVRYQEENGEGLFLFSITNLGNKAVCFTNPYLLGNTEEFRWVGVRIAELPVEQPGITAPPLQWNRLSLASSKGDNLKTSIIVLQPRASFNAITKGWFPTQHNASYLVQSVFCDYSGNDEVENIYRIRGCGTSEILKAKSK